MTIEDLVQRLTQIKDGLSTVTDRWGTEGTIDDLDDLINDVEDMEKIEKKS